MAFYNALIAGLDRIVRWASTVRPELYLPALVLIMGLLGASVCQGFNIFNSINNAYEITLKNPAGDDIAYVGVAGNTVHKVPAFDGQSYNALTVTYQQKSSWVQSILRPISFLWGAADKPVAQTVALKAASYEPAQTIAADSNLILTDTGPQLVGPQLSKALAVKMYARKKQKA